MINSAIYPISAGSIEQFLRNEDAPTPTSENRIDDSFVGQPHGNKHRRLLGQVELANQANVEGVCVLKPFGIDNSQMQLFIQIEAPEVYINWKFLAQFHAENTEKEAIFNHPEVKKALQNIELAIEKAFTCEPDRKNKFSLIVTAELLNWLQEINRRDHYLMVRSDGCEDSIKGANAGGNVSIAYVSACQNEFIQALGEVVSSYFKEKSLQNRFNTGQNPFTENLQLSVTSQELVGEEIGGSLASNQIPRSLVLFTNEPYYDGHKKYWLTRISGTFGHGEAVVGNCGVATDTILILKSDENQKLYFFYDNREKKTRLAPIKNAAGKIELQKVNNPSNLVHQRVFDAALLERLFNWGLLTETFFRDDATDIEIVVKNDIIYPVQARPFKREKARASYLDLTRVNLLFPNPIASMIETNLVVLGNGAAAMQIDTANEILLADSLSQVQEENLFLKDIHKLVVVAKEEPANSHPVVNFSGYGIPCLSAGDNFDKLKELILRLSENYSLVVCVQSSKIMLWDNQIVSVPEYCSEGFVMHPAKLVISLTETKALASKRVETVAPSQVKELLFYCGIAATSELALTSLQQLQEHHWIQSFYQKSSHLQQKIQAEVPLAMKEFQPLLNVSHELQSCVQQAFKSLEEVLKGNLNDRRLYVLFHVKVLETLLFSTQKFSGMLGQYSVSSLENNFAAAQEQIAYQKELAKPAFFIDELLHGSECPKRSVYNDWRTFLLGLEGCVQTGTFNAAAIRQFKDLLERIKNFNAVPTFMLFYFSKFFSDDPLQTANAILNLLPLEYQDLIQKIMHQKDNLRAIEQQIESFAEPKKIEKAYQNLKKEQLGWADLLINIEIKNWGKCPSLIRYFLIQTMHEMVCLFDLAIKTMKSSPRVTLSEKLPYFLKMLLLFLQMFVNWANRLSEPKAFPMHPCWTLHTYLKNIVRGLEDKQLDNFKLCEQELLPSQEFSVNAAMLGSSACYSIFPPVTLEDFFTLIHQNFNAIIAHLSKKNDVVNELLNAFLPQNLISCINLINSYQKNNDIFTLVQCIGLEVTHDQIRMLYSLPLNAHCGRITLIYNQTDFDSIQIRMQFFGLNKENWGLNRWQISEDLIHFFSKAHQLNLSDLKRKELELDFMLTVSESDFEKVFRLYAGLVKFSFFSKKADLLTVFSSYEELFAALEKDSTYSEESVRDLIISLYMELFALDLGWDSACRTVQKAIGYPHAEKFVVKLSQPLVKRAQKYSLGTEIAAKLVSPPQKLLLYIELVEAGHAYEAALKCANEHKSYFSAAKLYTALVAQDYGYDCAEKAASTYGSKESSLALYQQLFKRKRGFESAELMIRSFFENNRLWQNVHLLELSCLLAQYGHALELAAEIAFKALSPHNRFAIAKGLKICSELLKRGLYVQPIVEVVEKSLLLGQIAYNGQEHLFRIYCQLVEKGECYHIAAQALKDELEELRYGCSSTVYVLELCCALVARGLYRDIALEMLMLNKRDYEKKEGLIYEALEKLANLLEV